MSVDAPPQSQALLPASDAEIEQMERRRAEAYVKVERAGARRAKAQAAETKAKKEHARLDRALRTAKYPELNALPDDDADDDGDDDDE